MQMFDKQNLQITSKSLNYQHDLATQLFEKVAHEPWAMLLRSPNDSHVDSRYDILVARPVATIISKDDNTTISDQHHTKTSHDDPFTLLNTLLSEYQLTNSTLSNLPFTGGALGYFSYDLGRRIENLPSLAEKEISLPDMALGIYHSAIVVDHQLQSAYLIETDHTSLSWLLAPCHPNKQKPFRLTSRWQSNFSKDDYLQRFNRVQDYLRAGDCYQVNLAQRFCAEYQGDEWQAYLALEQANKGPFSAFIRLEQGAILSVSPERFIACNHGVIETKPIKGTRPRYADEQRDQQAKIELASAEKDNAENLMIVDLLRNDIGRVAKPGSVSVPKLFDIESFPAVHHLVSTVRGELDNHYTYADLLRACFPGGSITGAPKVRSMEIIEELETVRRSVYCGSIGYISFNGNMDTSITIRTLVAEKNQLYAWAGGGLVADSEGLSEYQETFDKLSKILSVLEGVNG